MRYSATISLLSVPLPFVPGLLALLTAPVETAPASGRYAARALAVPAEAA